MAAAFGRAWSESKVWAWQRVYAREKSLKIDEKRWEDKMAAGNRSLSQVAAVVIF